MSEWKRVKLSDVCEIPITDGTHQTPTYASESEGIPFLSSKDVTSQSIDWQNIKYITKDLHEVLYKRIAPKKDDVLLAKNGTTGVAALVEDDRVFDIYVTLALLRPKQNIVYPKYLLRVINSPFCKRQFDSHLKGIGVPNLHLKEINETKIPLPPLEEQKRIAAILDKCTEIIAKRKTQLAALDELVKARFVEMFGDPVQNPKGWKTKPLLSLGKCKNGMNFRYDEKGVILNCLGVGDFKDNSVISETDILPEVSLNEMPSDEYLLKDGDIVFVRSNGNKELVGRSVLVYPGNNPTTFSGFCIRYRKEDECIMEPYLLRVLKSDSIRGKMVGRGANIQNLNQQILAKIVIPLPPRLMQEEFSNFVAHVDKTRLAIQKSLEKTQLLFDSLMQEYFG